MKIRIIFLLAVMGFIGLPAMAQFQVKGTVTGANDSEPLIGATIMEKGTTNGCTTDIDGNYTLSVKSGNATLEVSYVGYQSQTVAVKGRNVINIVMNEVDTSLDEVVVVGYGTQKKSDVTGSVSSISSDDIRGLATVDAGAALQGKAAGVQILNP